MLKELKKMFSKKDNTRVRKVIKNPYIIRRNGIDIVLSEEETIQICRNREIFCIKNFLRPTLASLINNEIDEKDLDGFSNFFYDFIKEKKCSFYEGLIALMFEINNKSAKYELK